MKEKRNIHELIVKEAPSLNNLLDVKEFKALTGEYSLSYVGTTTVTTS